MPSWIVVARSLTLPLGAADSRVAQAELDPTRSETGAAWAMDLVRDEAWEPAGWLLRSLSEDAAAVVPALQPLLGLRLAAVADGPGAEAAFRVACQRSDSVPMAIKAAEVLG